MATPSHFGARDIKVICNNIGEGTSSQVSLCKIAKRGSVDPELYAVKTCYLSQLGRIECPVFSKNGRVRVHSGRFQIRRELGILRMLRNRSPHIVSLEYIKKRNCTSIMTFTRFAGRPIMNFCDESMSYSAWVEDPTRPRLRWARPILSGGPVRTLVFQDVETCLKQVLSALSVIHSLNIVHKDIKPDNVLLRSPLSRWMTQGVLNGTNSEESSPWITICDFNVSEQRGSRIFDAQGTTLFSPPECFHPINKKKGIDGFARDMWSVGILAWCLLCGAPLLMDPVPLRLQLALLCLDSDLELPKELGMPHDRLRKTIESLLQINPKKRPTAAQALAMLEELSPTIASPNELVN